MLGRLLQSLLLSCTAKRFACYLKSTGIFQNGRMWKGAESWSWFSQADIKSNSELNLLALSDSFMETELTAEWEIRGEKNVKKI